MSGGFTPHGDIGKPIQFEGSKKDVYNELVSLVDKYIASKSKGAKRMSGSVFVSMCAKYKLDIFLALAQCQIEGNSLRWVDHVRPTQRSLWGCLIRERLSSFIRTLMSR